MAVNLAQKYIKHLDEVELSIMHGSPAPRHSLRPTKPVSDLGAFMAYNYLVLGSGVALMVMVIMTIYEAAYRTITVYLGLGG